MTDPLKGFEFAAENALDVLKQAESEYRGRMLTARRPYAAALDDESRAAFYELCDLLQDVARLEGAVIALTAIQKAERRTAPLLKTIAKRDRQLEHVKQQLAGLEGRLKGKTEHIARLEATIACLKAEPQPAPVQPAPIQATPQAPTWDYQAPERRRPRRDEVVTESPFAVEVVARQVEEFVRRQGRCTKPDVSAAHPDLRPYLAVAYRHLHQSRRVRVDGWTLEVWREA